MEVGGKEIMREIKFRAWDKSKKEFVYTSPYDGHVICNNKVCTNEYGDLLGNTSYEAPEQFTGLLDKNGKEIYEGDVLRWIPNSSTERFPTDYIVRFGETTQEEYDTSHVCVYNGIYLEMKLNKYNPRQDVCYVNQMGIIGNIHESK